MMVNITVACQPRSFHRIPNEMREYCNFVVWKSEARVDGKTTKVPYQAKNGQLASVANPSHWSSFDDAITAAEKYDGIGFVFSEDDPFAGIDLDDTAGDASALERQHKLFKEFNSYSELSPSGKGLHIIAKGSVPSGRRQKHIEVYSSKRFFTMTGNVYLDKPIVECPDLLMKVWTELGDGKSPPPITLLNVKYSNGGDQEIIDRALNAANGSKFKALWDGDGSFLKGGDQSGSAIDQALVNFLQFYTKDPTQIERIWLASPQGQREKTRTRKDYRDRTIATAFDRETSPILIDELFQPEAQNPNSVSAIVAGEFPRPLRRELPPPKAFPIDALSTILGDAARAIVQKIQCPEPIAAMSVLGAASLAVQAHADVVIPATEHAKPLSLFLVTVAASGERKSAADFEALFAIRQFEKSLRDFYDGALPAYRNKMDAWEAERDKIKRDKKSDVAAKALQFDALGLPPIAPLKPMLTCPEPTFEGLCRLYVDGLPTLGIFSDEGGQFVGGHGLNPENRLRTITGLSGLWDGSAIKRVRVTDGVSVLPGRRLAVHLMMQPDVASTLLSDPVLKDQGFLSRILVAAPVGAAGTRFQRRTGYAGADALSHYNARLMEILRRTPPLASGKANELEPRRLSFDYRAILSWKDYADAVERRLGPGGDFEQIPGLANKLPEHAARIAGVLTLVDYLDALTISIDVLQRAILIAEYFASEALRLFDARMTSPEIRLAESLLSWITNKWSEPFIGLKAIYQFGPNAIREASTARKAVAVLVEHGWLQAAPKGTKVSGAVVREAWHVIRRPEALNVATLATPLPATKAG